MAQWLREENILGEDLSLVTSIHAEWLIATCSFISRWGDPLMASSGSTHTHMPTRAHTHTHNLKKKKIELKNYAQF